MADALPWTAVADGLRVTVRLTPKGGGDAIENVAALADGRRVLRARVRAAPTGGEANAALVVLFAKALGISRRAVRIGTGTAGRVKSLKIDGEASALAQRLEQILDRRSSAA